MSAEGPRDEHGLDYCQALPHLRRAPVIDGRRERGLVLRPLDPVGWISFEAAPPADQRAAYAAAWREDGLYVFVHVVDPDRVIAGESEMCWCGDSVEVFVDADGRYDRAPFFDEPGAGQLVAIAPADDDTPSHRGQAWCYGCSGDWPIDLDATEFVTVPTDDGYSLEMFVRAADLGLDDWRPLPGQTLGFDLAVNVSTATPTGLSCGSLSEGSRRGQYFLHVSDDEPREPWNRADAFCTAALLE